MPNVLVCIKAVPATTQVQTDERNCLRRAGAELQWNVADEAALEAALQLRGDGTVTVLTMGPEKLAESLRELLARGADRAVLVTDPAFAGADSYATTSVLAAACKALGSFGLILCGRRAMDGETGQVPPQLAAALGLPCITNAERVALSEGMLEIERRLEDGVASLEAQLPAVVSICEYACSLRLPGILSLRKAKEKQIERLSAETLGIGNEQCGLRGSLTEVVKLSAQAPGLRRGKKETDLSAARAKLETFLREVRR